MKGACLVRRRRYVGPHLLNSTFFAWARERKIAKLAQLPNQPLVGALTRITYKRPWVIWPTTRNYRDNRSHVIQCTYDTWLYVYMCVLCVCMYVCIYIYIYTHVERERYSMTCMAEMCTLCEESSTPGRENGVAATWPMDSWGVCILPPHTLARVLMRWSCNGYDTLQNNTLSDNTTQHLT